MIKYLNMNGVGLNRALWLNLASSTMVFGINFRIHDWLRICWRFIINADREVPHDVVMIAVDSQEDGVVVFYCDLLAVEKCSAAMIAQLANRDQGSEF